MISAPVIQSAIPDGQVQITRRHRRLPGQGGQQPRHGPEVRLAAVPDRGAVERADQRDARQQFLDQSLLAGLIGIVAGASRSCCIYYRLPGLVAAFALIYYTLVVYAIFRLVPVTLTLAGIAGFVLSVGMAVDANILIFERMKEELRVGKSLPAAVEAGFNRAWNSILDSNVSSLITATILYCFGSSVDPRLRARADHRRARLDVQRHRRHALDPALVVRQDWARKAVAVRPARGRVRGRPGRAGRPVDARRARVFDVIGKRRFFYILLGSSSRSRGSSSSC